MNRVLIASFAACVGVSIYAAEPEQDTGWKVAKQSSGVTIYSRLHPGSKLEEFKAIGDINASSHVVHNVIDDIENYPKFMPYTAEARVIERKDNSILTYQRISPKIVGDRDYTVRIENKSWPAAHGVAYLSEWKAANGRGPAEQHGVFRVQLVNGSWLLEPNGPDKTHATYFVFTDSGIAVPQFLANKISQTGILKLFAAVRKQASNPKYLTK